MAAKKAAAPKKATTVAGVPESDKKQAEAAAKGETAPGPKPKETTTRGATFDEAAKNVDPRYDDHPGFFGEVPDETPNSAYTVAGRIAGEPTPETSRDRRDHRANTK